ncbi:dipeptide epimerase [Hydrogenimonas urashimensis]|uniref:dipeptide epimerase n=1 Tax=Hydrogenimonas urashimensis TaxID=2740515 RepID=UPI001915C6C2|nr:dipeptide epimerase [Hydrogenimonas urashimensis]
MILADYRLTTVHIPLEKPFVTALRRVETATALRLELVSAEGWIGVGEAPPTVAITGESLEDIAHTLEARLLPQLLHRNLSTIDEAQEILHAARAGHTSAKAAADIALYNLFAQKEGMPLHAFLGGKRRPVKTVVTISLDTPKAMRRDALAAYARGYDLLKIKVGEKDGKDIARVRAIREVLPGATLLVDANQAWSERATLEFIEASHALDIELIEQPLPAHDLARMRRITACSPIPILADEAAFTLEDVRRVMETEAAHMVNVKLMKCGGIHKAKEILQWCRSHEVPVMLGSMLETPASIEASLHLAATFTDVIRYADLDSPLLYKEIPRRCNIRAEKNLLRLE